jgi:Sel1 repeat
MPEIEACAVASSPGQAIYLLSGKGAAALRSEHKAAARAKQRRRMVDAAFSDGGPMRRFGPAFLGILLAVAITVSARAGGFENGLDAFNSGDYVRAFSIWWPLARAGDPKSQASLGFLYYSGKGARRDDQQALFWFRKAADAGQPTAQYFLGVQYFYGRGVERDLAQAYSWCDIALTNGYSLGLSCRDAAELKMSAEDKQRSAELTAQFFRTHEFRN